MLLHTLVHIRCTPVHRIPEVALRFLPSVGADGGTTAFLALRFLPSVGADGRTTAFLALRFQPSVTVGAALRSSGPGRTTGPHSLHLDFCLPWEQMEAPPHSLQLDFSLPWEQMDAPPHSLHFDFRVCLPWEQMPHSKLPRRFPPSVGAGKFSKKTKNKRKDNVMGHTLSCTDHGEIMV
jgi:hypothetical protein